LTLPATPGGWPCILADPPWTHVTRSPKGVTSRAPGAHYATMHISEIRNLPVYDIADKNAHLFLWTTWPHMPLALDVMDRWGFAYSSSFLVWAKLNPRMVDALFMTDGDWHMGTGYTSRKNTEVLLLGRRGRPQRLSKSVRELMVAPRRKHSEKPQESFRRIEAYCPGPRVELFSRRTRPGWTTWGAEVGKFDGQP